jgi:predicted metal-dependent hydrolase
LLIRGGSRAAEEVALELRLLAHIPPGKGLRLQLTENRCNIVSVWRGRESYRVRAHRMFSIAEPRIVRALARYAVHNDARAAALISQFIELHRDLIHKAPRRSHRRSLRTRGRVHDLNDVFERLNRRYFAGKHDARITWGPARRCVAQQSVKVGSFSVEDRLIRIHPVLDQELVPAYFLEWIVFHEMLHGKHAIRRVGGKRCFHPPEFSQEERQFPHYGRARLWEKANLERLLS